MYTLKNILMISLLKNYFSNNNIIIIINIMIKTLAKMANTKLQCDELEVLA